MGRTLQTVRRVSMALAVTFALGGCSAIGLGGGEDDSVVLPDEPSPEARRAACDQLAAQAIGAEDLLVARRLAARASECYAAEVSRRN